MRHFVNLKRKVILIISISFFSFNLFSQCPKPIIPNEGKTINTFVPKEWFIKDSVFGDFNKDGLKDIVLVIAHDNENKDLQDYECARGMLILQKTKLGFVKSAYCNNAILCKNCGGVFGDPYNGITLEKNILQINHYGGSAWKWTQNYTFRFQQNKWELIGLSFSSFYSLNDCNGKGIGYAGLVLDEANFSTSKAHIIRTKEEQCKPNKDLWIPFKKKTLININQFDVEKEYMPIKIKN